MEKVAAAIEATFATKILSVGINHGEPKGVKHLHVHVLPRFEGDGGGIMQSLPGKKLIDKDFAGVAEAFAFQAGRDGRVVVSPSEVDDDALTVLAHDIAKKLEKEAEYAGQIKVTAIREVRASETTAAK